MKIACVFPGQGAQQVGMLADAAERWDLVADTFAEAADVLGYDLWHTVQQGPAETLNRTEVTQPALLTASVALWRVWAHEGGPAPAYVAGHSLGEYSALVAAGSLAFRDAVELVQIRGEAMQTAVPAGEGRMAAIMGLEDDQVVAICQDLANEGIVEAVNFNAPGQVVIAGATASVERAIEVCKAAGAKRALPLDVSVPSHCALMQPAADRMAGALAGYSVNDASIPVIQNVSAAAVTDAATIRENLYWQLISPVRWTASVQSMASMDVEALVECGPGKVLTGLTKRIERKLPCYPMETPEQLEQALNSCRDGGN